MGRRRRGLKLNRNSCFNCHADDPILNFPVTHNYLCLGGLHIFERISQQWFVQHLGGNLGELWEIGK